MPPPLATPTVNEQVIAFGDLSGYHREICSKLSPEETFLFLSEYYATAQRALAGSEARIVKFIGDAMLVILPADKPQDAVTRLRELKTTIDLFLANGRHKSRFRLKAHLGLVASGALGSAELERFDVCGLAVNQAALLSDEEWVLSDEFQKRASRT